jgi:hypothetical protein
MVVVSTYIFTDDVGNVRSLGLSLSNGRLIMGFPGFGILEKARRSSS